MLYRPSDFTDHGPNHHLSDHIIDIEREEGTTYATILSYIVDRLGPCSTISCGPTEILQAIWHISTSTRIMAVLAGDRLELSLTDSHDHRRKRYDINDPGFLDELDRQLDGYRKIRHTN